MESETIPADADAPEATSTDATADGGHSAAAFDDTLQEDLRLAAEGVGCEILEAAFRGGILRIVLDHPDGTTLAHCEEVSKRLSALLDVTDFGDSRYVLEVSSPGLDRKLYGPRDYVRFSGRLARVTWRDPERGKRTDVGRLAATPDEAPDEATDEATPDPRHLRLEVDGPTLEIPVADILEARLEIEI